MRSYLRYWGEAFRLPRWSPDDVPARIVLHDADRLIDAHADGRGVVAALPHTGNWDLAGAWACAAGMPLTTVAERLRPESLYRDFVAYRASLGHGDAAADRRRRRRSGCWSSGCGPAGSCRCSPTATCPATGWRSTLLGEPASLPTGPARLAQLTGAPLLPITCDYEPAGGDGPARMHLRMHPPVPTAAGPRRRGRR